MLCWHLDNDAKCFMSIWKNYMFYRIAELEDDNRADNRDLTFGSDTCFTSRIFLISNSLMEITIRFNFLIYQT